MSFFGIRALERRIIQCNETPHKIKSPVLTAASTVGTGDRIASSAPCRQISLPDIRQRFRIERIPAFAISFGRGSDAEASAQGLQRKKRRDAACICEITRGKRFSAYRQAASRCGRKQMSAQADVSEKGFSLYSPKRRRFSAIVSGRLHGYGQAASHPSTYG